MDNISKVLFFSIFTIYASCQTKKSEMIGTDWNLFKETPAWEYAKAVRDQEIVRFDKILAESKLDIDYEESKFGRSVLQVAVLNNLDKSVQKLLELGADPNHYSKTEGKTALHDAVGVFQHNDDTTVLSLLLKHNGDPNAFTHPQAGADPKNVISLLCGNVYSQPTKLKLLLKYNVDLNFSSDDNSNYLYSALRSKNYELVYILLQSGANYKKPILTKINGQKIYIQEYMKNQIIDLKSTDYLYKVKVIYFLEANGINYKNLKPSQETIERVKRNFPDYWEEYLNKF